MSLIDELRRAGASEELLYELLPDFIRYQDYYRLQPLRALMAVLEIQYRELAGDIGQLYDNWFIETCEPWVVPYIGDLLGMRELSRSLPGVFTQRSLVANCMALRRRKGTTTTLARAAQETTGWYTHAVEYRHLLGRCQSLEHLTPEQGRLIDLRDIEALDALGTPFDKLAHSVDVTSLPLNVEHRRSALDAIPGTGIAGYNLPTVGLFIWRLQVYPRSLATARQIEIETSATFPQAAGYTFHPFGLPTRLFHLPRTPAHRFEPSAEDHLPVPLPVTRLSRELEERRRGVDLQSRFLDRPPALRVRVRPAAGGEPMPIPPSRMWIYDLVDWCSPRPVGRPYEAPPSAGEEAPHDALVPPVLIDPVLGRLLFPHGRPGREVNVTYHYAASGDLGGGPYPRHAGLGRPGDDTWVGVVFRDADPDDPDERHGEDGAEIAHQDFAGPQLAIDAWRRFREETSKSEEAAPARAADELTDCPDGLIRIADNSSYGRIAEDPTPRREDGSALYIELSESERLIVEAAEQRAPCLVGDVLVDGGRNTALVLNGLWIQGSILICGSCDLYLVHCTVQPPPGRPAVSLRLTDDQPEGEVDALTLSVEHSLIDGAIRLPGHTGSLRITDSVVSSVRGGGDAIGGLEEGSDRSSYGPPLTLLRSTVLGSVSCAQIPFAASSLFTAPVRVIEPRFGEIRYSYLPPGSVTPRRFRCQPDLALEGCSSERERQATLAWLRPAFTSTELGDPGYAQLDTSCPVEIVSGAQDGSEMGAYHFLRQPQRASNLPDAMAEYLRWGHEARIRFLT